MATALDTIEYKLYKLVQFLRDVPGHKALTAPEIYEKSDGIDIRDEAVVAVLRSKPRIDVREDKELNVLKFAYKPKYNITCEDDLLTELANAGCKGLKRADVEDGGEEVKEIVNSMILKGRMIVEKHATSADEFLYRRSDAYYVPLPGTARVESNGTVLHTTHDLTDQVRRGDLILVQSAGTLDPYRVLGLGSERSKRAKYLPKCIESLKNLPHRYSASSWPTKKTDLSKISIETEKTLMPFDARSLPIDPPFRGKVRLEKAKLFKVGSTNDFRDMWREVSKKTRYDYPTHSDMLDDFLAKNRLVQGELVSTKEMKTRRGPKRKRKRRRVIGSRTTNAHMLK